MASKLEIKKLKQARDQKKEIAENLSQRAYQMMERDKAIHPGEWHPDTIDLVERSNKAEADLKAAEQELQKAIEPQQAPTEVPPETPQMPDAAIPAKPQETKTEANTETNAKIIAAQPQDTGMDTDTAEQTDTPTGTKNNVLDTLLEKVKGGGNKIVNTLIQKCGDKNE